MGVFVKTSSPCFDISTDAFIKSAHGNEKTKIDLMTGEYARERILV